MPAEWNSTAETLCSGMASNGSISNNDNTGIGVELQVKLQRLLEFAVLSCLVLSCSHFSINTPAAVLPPYANVTVILTLATPLSFLVGSCLSSFSTHDRLVCKIDTICIVTTTRVRATVICPTRYTILNTKHIIISSSPTNCDCRYRTRSPAVLHIQRSPTSEHRYSFSRYHLPFRVCTDNTTHHFRHNAFLTYVKLCFSRCWWKCGKWS